ncbi:MAG: hypothetical protein ABWY49_13705 [Rhizobium sp.]
MSETTGMHGFFKADKQGKPIGLTIVPSNDKEGAELIGTLLLISLQRP